MDREEQANLILIGGIALFLCFGIGVLIMAISLVRINVEIMLITIFVAVTIPIFISEWYRYHHRDLLYASIAKELGLEADSSTNTFFGKHEAGNYKGYPIKFYGVRSHVSKDFYNYYYHLQVGLSSSDYDLYIQPKTLLSDLLTERVNRLVFDDPEFDKAFLVISDYQSRTRLVLSPALRRRMLDFREGILRVSAAKLTHTLKNKMMDAPYWKKTADILTDLADAIENTQNP